MKVNANGETWVLAELVSPSLSAFGPLGRAITSGSRCCVAQFTAADGAVAKFKAASSYSRDNVISEFVKTVASTSMDYSLAKACAAGVEAELARTATKS